MAVAALAAGWAYATVACSSGGGRSIAPIDDAGDGSDSGSPSLPPRPDAEAPEEAGADAAVDRSPLPDEPVECEVSPCAVELAGGNNHFCARLESGEVRCWGSNDYGQLGERVDPHRTPATNCIARCEALHEQCICNQDPARCSGPNTCIDFCANRTEARLACAEAATCDVAAID